MIDSRTLNKGFYDGSKVLGNDRVWELRIRVVYGLGFGDRGKVSVNGRGKEEGN